MGRLRAALFDKDGTLVDFHRTWAPALGAGLRAAAPDAAMLERAAAAVGFDLHTDSIADGSPLVAESNETIAELLREFVDPATCLDVAFAEALRHLTPSPGVPAVLTELRRRDVALAVVTNDWASVAADQLNAMECASAFDHVVGADSGFGAKPEPGMILGALDLLAVSPDAAIVVGDSIHDLRAGHHAGATTVLVTNGSDTDPAWKQLADLVVATLDSLVPALTSAGLLDD